MINTILICLGLIFSIISATNSTGNETDYLKHRQNLSNQSNHTTWENIQSLSNISSIDIGVNNGSVPVDASIKHQSSSLVAVPTLNSLRCPTIQVDKPDQTVSNNLTTNLDNKTDSNSTFLSFNEWREAKLSEIPSILDRPLKTKAPVDASCYKENNVIGEEMEIDVGVFTDSSDEDEKEDGPAVKIYKDKFNYASIDCAATIMKSNSDAIGAGSILIENKDSYLLNPCSAPNKFVIIELCQDILVEEIVMANFEFFSSTFKDIKFLVSNRYPVSKSEWKTLGTFQGENSRDIQKFKIENPQIWARYLRIEILSHYDDEFYCPISIVRVHGKTMMDEYKMSNIKETSEDAPCIENSEEVSLKETTIVENCDPLPDIPPENITDISNLSKMSGICTSQIVPLKFDQFLMDFNNSYCPPKATKDMQITSSSVSSSSTEESIFKNIMKRLSILENNATLTVLYIEEQSKLLYKSFEKLEKNHATKFSDLIGIFNATVVSNLDALGDFANQLKEQSLKILEEQKLNNDHFTTQTEHRLKRMENQLGYQRRLIYSMLFFVAGLVLFLILNKEITLEDDNDGNDWIITAPPLEKLKKFNSSMSSTYKEGMGTEKTLFRSPSNSSLSASSIIEPLPEENDSNSNYNSDIDENVSKSSQSEDNVNDRINETLKLSDIAKEDLMDEEDMEWEF
ncbi:hypothetical protein Kpol_2000p70 [Vanderwaltozyma polyspora DSM 70294]|uniref:SUN-like protein 1 n=1 Tax=Vanderwaltozyma polyspora (strain ATCC 22028 / DSM 70294 / BCRC 21397 / CBS 2163 / NBRC 10782 / NRRL Y-8283 / UCD 57-17) TaxID=436907 RepID=A7TF77_VANPO|nr:uncharacterized protein Kpol_2000p70 [Vanderwaltozyma polyspora DSM 70294]EDO19102.1 hypothetical protein Kpol_2000p70 [Vanderwaltozyma polyspora DSM 70294]